MDYFYIIFYSFGTDIQPLYLLSIIGFFITCKKCISMDLNLEMKMMQLFYKNHLMMNSADIIWWENIGVMVSPDFFHNKVENIRGMHEYNDSKGFCLDAKASGIIESDNITSVYSKIIRSLESSR